MEFTLTFIRIFSVGIYLTAPLWLSFCLFIIVLGQIVGRIEGWSKFDATYWALITALTVGYGDIRPLKKRTKSLSIVIAIAGIMLTGMFVALTIHSASHAFENQIDMQKIIQLEEKKLR